MQNVHTASDRSSKRKSCHILDNSSSIGTKKRSKLNNISPHANIISQFNIICREGPEYVCCSCFRALFKYQVKLFCNDKYEHQDTIRDATSSKYVHTCNDLTCAGSCTYASSQYEQWVCFTCDRHLKRGKIPPESHGNKLNLDEIPHELQTSNNLERQLLALSIPFTKIINLPRGGQKGAKGPVICVPSKIDKTTDILPRPLHDAQIVPVQLKRKLEYKGFYKYELVDVTNLYKCLKILSDINPHYKELTIQDSLNTETGILKNLINSLY